MQELQEMPAQPLGEKIPWSRAWQLTPAFLPGKLHGQRSLVGYNLQGHKESDRAQVTWHAQPENLPELTNGI